MSKFALLAALVSQISAFAATPLATENVPPSEPAAKKKVVATIKAQVTEGFNKTGKAVRDAHPKAHGCVLGDFQVNSTLPENLRRGVFQEGAHYPTWIRFSNGSATDDTAADGRGMALKLMNVTATPKLETDEKFTQDFLMINHDVFFVRNAADYVEFTAATAKGNPIPFFFPSVNPLKWRLHEMGIARTIQKKKLKNPLAVEYGSLTPYLLGKGQAVKHFIVPVGAGPAITVDQKSKDRLGLAMKEHLDHVGMTYEFFVQVQVDGDKMPIEDPTISWDKKLSKPIKVATVTIPAQSFRSEAQQEFCENLSFNPWHSLPEHRPLGGINRVRRTVYQTISEVRHELNKAPRVEPTGNETFN